MDQPELPAEFAALSQLIAERMAEGDLAAVLRHLTELLALPGVSMGARLQTGDSAEIGGLLPELDEVLGHDHVATLCARRRVSQWFPVCLSYTRLPVLEESIMTATYTFDVFSSLDGYGGVSGGDWGGYWGKQGPELLDHRLALYEAEQRMVFGANTYRAVRADAGLGHREVRGA